MIAWKSVAVFPFLILHLDQDAKLSMESFRIFFKYILCYANFLHLKCLQIDLLKGL